MKFRSPHGYLVHHLFKIFRLYPEEIPNHQVPDPVSLPGEVMVAVCLWMMPFVRAFGDRKKKTMAAQRWVINKDICHVVCRQMQSISSDDWQMLFLEFPWYDADFLRQTDDVSDEGLWKQNGLRLISFDPFSVYLHQVGWCLNHISRFCFNFNIKTKFYCRAVRMQECEVAKSCVSCTSRNVATNHLLYWFSCHSLRNLLGEEKADKQW